MRESKSRALPLGYTPISKLNGVNSGTRTHDFQSHNLALYQLNYIHHKCGTPEGIRTPDTRLRRAVLYPAELLVHISPKIFMERVMGIGPTQPAWKAGALPLSYTRTTIIIFAKRIIIIPLKTIVVNNFF